MTVYLSDLRYLGNGVYFAAQVDEPCYLCPGSVSRGQLIWIVLDLKIKKKKKKKKNGGMGRRVGTGGHNGGLLCVKVHFC